MTLHPCGRSSVSTTAGPTGHRPSRADRDSTRALADPPQRPGGPYLRTPSGGANAGLPPTSTGSASTRQAGRRLRRPLPGRPTASGCMARSLRPFTRRAASWTPTTPTRHWHDVADDRRDTGDHPGTSCWTASRCTGSTGLVRAMAPAQASTRSPTARSAAPNAADSYPAAGPPPHPATSAAVSRARRTAVATAARSRPKRAAGPSGGAAGRQDRVHPARRRALGGRHRRRPGAGRVLGQGLLPVMEPAEPGHRDQRGLPGPHPRGQPPVGARARLGQLPHHRGLAQPDPRAGAAPALLPLATLPALRRRGERGDGRAGRHRRRPGVAHAVHRVGFQNVSHAADQR